MFTFCVYIKLYNFEVGRLQVWLNFQTASGLVEIQNASGLVEAWNALGLVEFQNASGVFFFILECFRFG